MTPVPTADTRRDTAEQFLAAMGVAFVRQNDGSLFVKDNLSLSSKRLTQLPDLSDVIVGGHFWCDNNHLTSLKGCPKEVRGDFYCYSNDLSSLKGAPHKVGGGFFCSDNQLMSLRHAPRILGGDLYCHNNKLRTLEHAPRKCGTVKSDFGIYPSIDKVPDIVRYSAETRERLSIAHEKALTRDATTTRRAISVHKPLQLRKHA
jgi:hypothetical protein